MPLVLTENDATESGIVYEDRTGVSYQFPKMYRRLIVPGEPFLYYRGRRKVGGGRQPQIYFGVGVVGQVSQDPAAPERLNCFVLDYRPFQSPVPFKDLSGSYRESGGARRGYYQRGVRSISDSEFASVLEAAALPDKYEVPAGSDLIARAKYASPENIRAIERFAVDAALVELRRRYPIAAIRELPRNNPGFDIEITAPEGLIYVEVKGTERGSPQFFITEGELQFSRAHPSQYRLIVIYQINRDAGTYTVFWHDGPIHAGINFRLQPIQWVCEVSGVPANPILISPIV